MVTTKNKDSQLVQESKTSDLGITAVIVYASIFFYAYINAFYNKKSNLGLAIINPNNGITVTHAMFNSEKIGVALFLSLFITVILYILVKQNYQKYILGIICMIIIVSFGLLLGGFMYISTNMIFLHTLMAAVMFVGGQIFAFSTLALYNESYPNDDVSEMTTTIYALTALFVVIMILIGINGYSAYKRKGKKISMSTRLLWDLLGVAGLVHIVLFGSLLYIISIYPPLIS